MTALRSLVVLAAALTLAVPVARAADQPIKGNVLAITDPGSAAGRRVAVSGRELSSPASVSGDPTIPANSSAAVLQILVDGATPSAQTFMLAPGTSARGRVFWRTLSPAGFKYADPTGEHGPVRKLRVMRSPTGKFDIAATLRGDAGIVPPNPGTEAFLLLTLGTGDRYCVRFGADATVRRDDGRSFSVRRPSATGCPNLVSGELVALSYNVAGLPEGISGSHPEANTPIIAPLLNNYDLVLLQETWKTPDPNPLAPTRVYHEILEAGSTHPFKSVSALQPFNTDPRRPNAIVADGLNMFSQFPFGELTREMWTHCDPSAADCLSLKGFTMARMTIAPGVTVDVYDLHGEAGGTPNDDVLRGENMMQLAAFIQANSVGRPLIVGGDFNLHTNDEPDSTQFNGLLTDTGLADVCATLSCPEPGRIDKLLFRSSDTVTITPLSWRFETDVFIDGNGDPLSDHDALAVRFAWSVTP